MQLYFSELRKHREPYSFEETLDLEQQLKERFPDLVLGCSLIEFSGLVVTDHSAVTIDARIVCELTVPSTRSLAPVQLKLDFPVNEIYVEDDAKLDDYSDEEVVVVVEDDVIDLNRAVEDNIVLQVPMQVLTSDEVAKGTMPSGNGWQVRSEKDEQAEATKNIDPRLAKLQDLFKDNDSEQ
ncbi:YceD family protein [Pediococcus claussenii]|uniref:DUF177 domain-containing protein n=1 Tax=Pediococcus claussenii (strain ATCC BAA-344 / DSM 14800 / JCM 18046 / KCTC 3811 / LMG 21948 / P06) TaxID=701521 RepID=G8PDP9_PEDCP|nr:DUF177 domain-containing protein [Pediococcus claussenii]AEV95384.1 hypothetical protein PECL_1122 [Pediococcus claussenii ATCC BAA-344]ANZ68915.1 metal-binding protein [Pediococcus claussenii]ANZ70731.1 metal-binding protein [Pediococcus claussenii]KRN19027.1 hypothetical protein IV79_GL001689 [Pediococcus claussenii]